MYGRIIFAALAALFVFPLVAELALGIDPSVWGPIEMAMVTAFVIGIDAFWWWVLFLRREPPAEAGVNPASPPPTPRALRQALALPDARPNVAGQRALLEFKAWQTLIVLAVIGGFWLFTGGDLEHGVGGDEIGIWVAMVLAPTLILLVRLFTGLAGEGREDAEAEAATLGLHGAGLGKMTGTRRGREIDISVGARDSVVIVRAATPEFGITAADGKLTASSNAPHAVELVVGPLRKAKRWRGMELRAGSGAVTLQRHGGIADGWLYDLWLGERILDELAAEPQ